MQFLKQAYFLAQEICYIFTPYTLGYILEVALIIYIHPAYWYLIFDIDDVLRHVALQRKYHFDIS